MGKFSEAPELEEYYKMIDIVLMDIQLPEMNGLDALRLIKSQNMNLPVIAQTAYVTPISS